MVFSAWLLTARLALQAGAHAAESLGDHSQSNSGMAPVALSSALGAALAGLMGPA